MLTNPKERREAALLRLRAQAESGTKPGRTDPHPKSSRAWKTTDARVPLEAADTARIAKEVSALS